MAKAVANAAAMLVLKAKNVAQVAEDTGPAEQGDRGHPVRPLYLPSFSGVRQVSW